MVATWQLQLPQLAELSDLNKQITNLSISYAQSGDAGSAPAALKMDVNLGQQLESTPTSPLITQLVGVAVERSALRAMDPNSPTQETTYHNEVVDERKYFSQEASLECIACNSVAIAGCTASTCALWRYPRSRKPGRLPVDSYAANRRGVGRDCIGGGAPQIGVSRL